MNRPSNFITTIDTSLASELKKNLEDQGFDLSRPTHTIFQAKRKGVSCTLYESGKLVVQGKEKDDFIDYYLEPEILGTFSYTYPEIAIDRTPHIGVDEAGKGDVFGPLCIAALYANKKMISELITTGIRDSKRLTDSTIIKFSTQIKRECPHSIVQIFPKRYNELYNRFKNLNRLLAWAHATAIEELVKKTDCRAVVIDRFADEHVVEDALKGKALAVELSQRHRGEEDVVVAGASILARAAFVRGIETLGSQFNLTLPKGASSGVIEAGRRFVRSHGELPLKEVAKLHFKTVRDFI
ncbi:MAG: ribonuclease HIII [Chlamydiota bacterium]